MHASLTLPIAAPTELPTGWDLADELARVAAELAELIESSRRRGRFNNPDRLVELGRRNRELVELQLWGMGVALAAE